MRTIDFYFDFLGPFAYLARHRPTLIADRHDCAITWHAIDPTETKLAAGNSGPGSRDMPVKLNCMKSDRARRAAKYAVPFNWAGNYASRRMHIGALYACERDAEAP